MRRPRSEQRTTVCLEMPSHINPHRARDDAAEGPNPVDVHAGRRVRLRRTLLGMSQGRLAEALGVTFQQVQKYERGTNRIGASRLHDIARILGVPVSYFFDEMETSPPGHGEREAAGGPRASEREQMSKRETLELVRAYYRIPDRRVRKRVVDLLRSIADSRADDSHSQ